MVYFDTNGIFYSVLAGLTANVTGSWFLTLMAVTLLVMAFSFAFRIPIEFTVILVFPLLIGFGAMTGSFMPVLGVGIIYMAILVSKNAFFWR